MIDTRSIIGKTAAIKKVFEQISGVAKSNATVLLFGENGTGKELLAHSLHNESERKDKPFIAVNCAAIPETLLESELFGHEKGSFTGAYEQHIGKFEAANGGTIFLDEIGSLPLSLQAKILRVLQNKVISRIGSAESVALDLRIVSATNTDLKKAVDKKLFREDLFYRLNVVPIHVPPLRQRCEDIPLILDHFLKKFNAEYKKKIKGFKDDVTALLISYDWPGNVRELENLVERLVALTKCDYITKESLPKEITLRETSEKVFAMYKGPGKRQDLEAQGETLKDQEKESILKALKEAQGNRSKAAEILGIHRNTLRKKMKLYDIK